MDLGFAQHNQAMGSGAAQLLGQVVGVQESMLDDELRRLDNLDECDLAKIRARRVTEMKAKAVEESAWSRQGHGALTTLTDTKEFFDAAKASKRLACHFSRPTSHHCVALNGALAKLAAQHRETRFCAMDAEKSPYLCEKLLADPEGNVVIPTVLLCKDGKVVYHVRGLEEVGGERVTADRVATVLQRHGLIDDDAMMASEHDGSRPHFASLDEYRAHRIREGFYDQALADADEEDDFEPLGDALTVDARDA